MLMFCQANAHCLIISLFISQAWQLSCLRNDSFVYDNFYGLYKSKCVCPLCNKVTVKFGEWS